MTQCKTNECIIYFFSYFFLFVFLFSFHLRLFFKGINLITQKKSKSRKSTYDFFPTARADLMVQKVFFSLNLLVFTETSRFVAKKIKGNFRLGDTHISVIITNGAINSPRRSMLLA